MTTATSAPVKTVFRRVAIIGNPNSGKTTLFNALTGLRQKVGNYPGVTVEKKVGRFFGSHGELMELLDLPGTYSLQVRSPDEAITRDVLLGLRADTARPDAVICVVDASNLARNLYLVAQILELQIPVVIALNMVDLAEARGQRIDLTRLRRELGVPVVPTVATRRTGLIELRQALSQRELSISNQRAPMPSALAQETDLLAKSLVALEGLTLPAAETRAAYLLSLGDAEAVRSQATPAVAEQTALAFRCLHDAGFDPVSEPVEARYAWIQTICDAAERGQARDHGELRLTWSDRLDLVLTHRIWGWVIFLGVMGLMFFSIFTLAEAPMTLIETIFGSVGDGVKLTLPDGYLRDLLVDGVVAGVGSVVVFLPQIVILFFFIGLLEDTGYMARAAFIIDRVMCQVGLNGKSFIPLLSCFACAIPGIMATRTIENPRDRLATILVAPLMSCSARLPVYTLLIAAMLPSGVVAPWEKAGIMLGMYLLGMAAAFVAAWFFKKSLLKSESSPLILELPPYRFPHLRWVLLQIGQRSWMFLRRAGTVILAIAIVLWALSTFPKNPDPNATPSDALAYSAAGRVGHALEPLILPLGFDWKIGIGLISSFAAREVFVSTMGVIYNVEGQNDEAIQPLRAAILVDRWPDGRQVFTPLVCISLMVFYVLALQCMSTVAVVRRETNSWRWPLFQLAYMTTLAYVGSLVVYQGGRVLGL
jgi:ferrous iron transport protein B